MEGIDYDVESEELHERMVDDIKYAYLPMDWDPIEDLLESFNPEYLQDTTFDINSNIFKRFDGADLRTLNFRKRVIKELIGADVNAKTKGYARELYEKLTFDEGNKNILYKGKSIFIRDITNNNLVLTDKNSQTLQEFRRLVGRVIVETDENRKVNEEKAKRIRLSLDRLRNLLTREGELE